jgi:hypothetical protein
MCDWVYPCDGWGSARALRERIRSIEGANMRHDMSTSCGVWRQPGEPGAHEYVLDSGRLDPQPRVSELPTAMEKAAMWLMQ